jgi:TolB-like protein
LKRASSIAATLVLLLRAAGPVCAQSPASSSDTAIVMPFDNASGAPGIEWIAESFPELLSQRLASPTIYVLTRDDRVRAYDRAGIPASMHPSRATIYRLVEQMDVDYVVLGRYTFDGRTFTANAQVLDMRSRKLLPESQESGPLVDLINIETSLALDLLHSMRPNLSVSRQEIESSAPPFRLDAFENFVRGILDTSAADKARHFQEDSIPPITRRGSSSAKRGSTRNNTIGRSARLRKFRRPILLLAKPTFTSGCQPTIWKTSRAPNRLSLSWPLACLSPRSTTISES